MSGFDEQAWEERYRTSDAVWSGQPNSVLSAEVADLPPGEALDVGCGEGADALWLAERGWHVTAVDFSRTALERGAAQANARGAEVSGRVHWVHADLTCWAPQEASFDLVSAQFMHLPNELRAALFVRLATAVAPGGTLLVVGHHPDDMHTTVHRPTDPGVYYTAAEVAADLGNPDHWEVLVADARPRTVGDPAGREVVVRDAVLRARKLRAW